MLGKPRLLVLSSVLPFPRTAGQENRVYYTLKALRNNFHLTFLTVAEEINIAEIELKLLELCDAAIVLPSKYLHNWPRRIFHKVVGTVFTFITGLKFSNYLIGEVEFSPQRLASVLKDLSFDAILFEYWHTFKVTNIARERGIPSILDMHNILWRSYARQLDVKVNFPDQVKRWFVNRYKTREEIAWNAFDMLIAINLDEYGYTRQKIRKEVNLVYLPMGIDMAVWPQCWLPATPKRVAYYGGLGSPHNQQDALLCYREIMPLIWEQFPLVEFWIVGSNPPGFISDLERDQRVHVTGFVDQPQAILKTMTLVLCPWSGTYGFRSRVVEVMALGVPVIASSDAVYGMGFDKGSGIIWGNDSAEMATNAVNLLHDESELHRQSYLARLQVEEKFSYEATYFKLSAELVGIFCETPVRQRSINAPGHL